jgi:hypothetical protein
VVPLPALPVCARTGPAMSRLTARNAISVFIPVCPSEVDESNRPERGNRGAIEVERRRRQA